MQASPMFNRLPGTMLTKRQTHECRQGRSCGCALSNDTADLAESHRLFNPAPAGGSAHMRTKNGTIWHDRGTGPYSGEGRWPCIPGRHIRTGVGIARGPRITEAFRSGGRMGWLEHEESVFCGCGKFFRGDAANLITSWIPSLERVAEKLALGAEATDVGCGKEASTKLMNQNFTDLTTTINPSSWRELPLSGKV